MSDGAKTRDAAILAVAGTGGGTLALPLVLGPGDASASVAHDDGGAVGVRGSTAAGGEELERIVTEPFEELGRPVFRFVRGVVRDTTIARDLTQEAFVRLCTELRAGRRVADTRAWLFRVAHNLAIDEQRRSRVRGVHESAIDPSRRRSISARGGSSPSARRRPPRRPKRRAGCGEGSTAPLSGSTHCSARGRDVTRRGCPVARDRLFHVAAYRIRKPHLHDQSPSQSSTLSAWDPSAPVL